MVKQAYTLYENLETLPAPEGKDVEALFREICRRGMKKRGLLGIPEYEDRLEEETALIFKKNFPVYFVVLWDIIRYARKEGIPIGHGRGSACGSLVCYVMEITQVDPLEHNLLFWRFLSEWRDGYPDVDTDVADKHRGKLKKYIEDKYGADHVASVATYIYFSPKSAIKAACRVMAVPYKEANDLVKDIETLQDFRKVKYKEFHTKYPDVYKLAKGLDGRLSGTGYHAAATIISQQVLTDLTSVETRKLEGEDFRQPVIALDKDDAEEIGFIKYDFLGLKTLSVVDDCVKAIQSNHGRMIDTLQITNDDDKVFAMISEGNTVGVFQAEASASTKVIKEMGIENFTDLVASNALVRPGAWKAFGAEYIARKKGYKKVTYPTPHSEGYLKDTWGFYLFQEQSMLVCTEIAGLSKEDADKIRKLTAHKEDVSKLAPFKEKFLNGAMKQVSQKVAEKLWNDIELTAEYSFNKCLASDTTVEVKFGTTPNTKIETMTVERLYAQMKLVGDKVDFYLRGPATIGRLDVGAPAWHKVSAVYDAGVNDVWRVWTDSETYIDATSTHKHRLSKNWKEAFRIGQGDQIWTDKGKVKVAGNRYAGQQQTYDIMLETEPHAFYANGFLTSNSHSVAYSKLSYITAWLKYYYPAEFMTALLNNEKDQNSISDYLSECKRLGIEVKTPDVNKSGMGYTTSDNVIYMGLSNIKYISDKLAERLINLRPFLNYSDMSSRIMEKGSGLSSRVIDSLNKVGAAEFKDHPVDRQACKNNYYEYLGIASFDDGLITAEMRTRITALSDYEDKSTAIIVAIVQDIVSKNGWTRADLTDGTGKTGVFLNEGHGLEKGQKYIIALANGSLVGSVNLADAKPNAIVNYLRGNMDEGTWIVAAKSRLTKNGNEMGTFLFSHRGSLRACTIFGDKMPMARKFGPGSKVKIAIEPNKKFGDLLKGIKRDE